MKRFLLRCLRTWLCDVELSLDNSEVNNYGKTPTRGKLFLIAANGKLEKIIFQGVPSETSPSWFC